MDENNKIEAIIIFIMRNISGLYTTTHTNAKIPDQSHTTLIGYFDFAYERG